MEDVAFWNATLSGTGLTQITQDAVALVIHILAEHELPEENSVYLLILHPARWRVVRSKEKVHCESSEDSPVVCAILDDVGPWHSVIGEAVNKKCLVLALQVVDQCHRDTQFLHVQQLRI